jgi:anti-sigma factor RsiW
MSTERTPKSDKELWQSLVFDTSPAAASVSDLDFAAWLEGRLPEARAAEVDAAVAADPALRRSAVELSEILGMPLPAASPRMAVRAQALVGFAVEKQSPRRSWLAAMLPSFGGGFSFQRGAMAGLAMVIATVGFVMGGGLGESFATEKYATVQSTTSAPLGVDTSGQLNDLFTDSL